MNFLNRLVVVIFLYPSLVTGALYYRDDECLLLNGDSGIYKVISDCPAAIDDLTKGVFPQQFGFEGKQVIVCCPHSKAPTTSVNPTATTPRATTQNSATPPKGRPDALPPGKSRILSDECLLVNGDSGIYKVISDCPAAIDDLTQGVFPQQFGFEGIQIIVCCPHSKAPTISVNPTATTPRATTQNSATPPMERPDALPPGKSRIPGENSDFKQLTEDSDAPLDLSATTIANLTSTTPRATTQYTTLPPMGKLDAQLPGKSRIPGEISNNKCRQYTNEVYPPGQVMVIGGVPALRGEFPHMVQLGYDGSGGLKWTCGGSLISDKYVVTAAHCLSDRSLGVVKYARIGLVNLEDEVSDQIQQFKVLERIPHPDYKAPSYYNDIGLIKLDKKVLIHVFVRPACIYTNNATLLTNVIASGWGKVDFAGEESTVLRKVDLELYDQPACDKIYRQPSGSARLKDGIKDDIMICAGHSKELKDTCQGDSGGPLQVSRNTTNKFVYRYDYDLVGITSFGKACGIAVDVPAVYTRVSYYTKWIEDIVWPPT